VTIINEELNLIEKAKRGDNSAFNFLYNKYYDYINKIAIYYKFRYSSIFKIEFSEKELFHVLMLALWDAVRKFDFSKRIKFNTFLIWKIKGKITELLRFEINRGNFLLSLENFNLETIFSNLITQSSSPRDIAFQREVESILRKTTKLISPNQRRAINLIFFSESSYTPKEAANVMEIKCSAFRVLLDRAYKSMKKILEENNPEFVKTLI